MEADVPEAKAELLHAIYERITVAGPEIVVVRLPSAAYAHGLALALPEKVEMARPTGVGRAITAYDMPIEGRDEWLTAARRLAMRTRSPGGRRPARHGPKGDRAATNDLQISRATDRKVVVVAAVLVAGSEKAAAHRLGLSHSTVKHHLANARSKVGAETTAQLVWILASRPPELEGMAKADE